MHFIGREHDATHMFLGIPFYPEVIVDFRLWLRSRIDPQEVLLRHVCVCVSQVNRFEINLLNEKPLRTKRRSFCVVHLGYLLFLCFSTYPPGWFLSSPMSGCTRNCIYILVLGSWSHSRKVPLPRMRPRSRSVLPEAVPRI
jgi:hypothetical protein